MREIQTIGIDLAKHSFYVYGVNATGKKSLEKTIAVRLRSNNQQAELV